MATLSAVKHNIRTRTADYIDAYFNEHERYPVDIGLIHGDFIADELYAGFDWSDNVEGFHDFSIGTPANPLMFERWISTTDTGSYQKDYIYEWDGIQWVELDQRIGKPYWIKNQKTHRYYDGDEWVQFVGSGVTDHRNLDHLNSANFWHLTQAEYHALLLLPAAIADKESAGVAAGLVEGHENHWDHNSFLTELPEHNHDHNNLSGLDVGDYQHLSQLQKTDLTDGGDSSLHYHSTDRNRANHSGTQAISTVSGLQNALDSKQPLNSKLTAISNLSVTSGNIIIGNGSTFVSRKLQNSDLPAIAITDTFVVANQSAMLALSAAERGDVAIRSDLNKSFILKGDDYSKLEDWQELLSPTDAVLSVDGRTGVVSLADKYQPLNTYLTAIAGLTPTARNVIIGTGTTWTRRALAEDDLPSLSISKITGLQSVLDGKSNTSHNHDELRGNNYISGGNEKPVFFGSGKLRYQMLSGNNLGATISWVDALWISSYTGPDVKTSNLLVFSKDSGNPFIGFCQQTYDASDWGPLYTLYGSHNFDINSKLDMNHVSNNVYNYRSVFTIRFTGVTHNTTGTLKINLPSSWSNVRYRFEMRGYAYYNKFNTYGSWRYVGSGFAYYPDSRWYLQGGHLLEGNPPFNQIRYTHDGSRCCILLGNVSTTWTNNPLFPVIIDIDVITDASISRSGWSFELLTSEDGYAWSNIQSITPSIYGHYMLVQNRAEITESLDLRGDIRIRNASNNAWLNFATRAIVSNEVVMNLSNIGSITTTGNIDVGGTVDIRGDYVRFRNGNNTDWDLPIRYLKEPGTINKGLYLFDVKSIYARGTDELFISSTGGGIMLNGKSTFNGNIIHQPISIYNTLGESWNQVYRKSVKLGYLAPDNVIIPKAGAVEGQEVTIFNNSGKAVVLDSKYRLLNGETMSLVYFSNNWLPMNKSTVGEDLILPGTTPTINLQSTQWGAIIFGDSTQGHAISRNSTSGNFVFSRLYNNVTYNLMGFSGNGVYFFQPVYLDPSKVKAGTSQAGAGAAAGELWRNTSTGALHLGI